MALRDGYYPVVADLSFTTSEIVADIDTCFKMIFLPTEDCLISLNDNQHYKKYPKAQPIPVELNSANHPGVNRVYYKGATAAGVLGIWGFR